MADAARVIRQFLTDQNLLDIFETESDDLFTTCTCRVCEANHINNGFAITVTPINNPNETEQSFVFTYHGYLTEH